MESRVGRDGIKNSRGWNKITKQSKIDKDKERESKEKEERKGKRREGGEKDRSKKIYCKWPRSWPFAVRMVSVMVVIIMIDKKYARDKREMNRG